VEIPRGGDTSTKVSEHLIWYLENGSSAVTIDTALDGQICVLLARLKWDVIADEMRVQFRMPNQPSLPPHWLTGMVGSRRSTGGCLSRRLRLLGTV
jgi:hypothetical protein